MVTDVHRALLAFERRFGEFTHPFGISNKHTFIVRKNRVAGEYRGGPAGYRHIEGTPDLKLAVCGFGRHPATPDRKTDADDFIDIGAGPVDDDSYGALRLRRRCDTASDAGNVIAVDPRNHQDITRQQSVDRPVDNGPVAARSRDGERCPSHSCRKHGANIVSNKPQVLDMADGRRVYARQQFDQMIGQGRATIHHSIMRRHHDCFLLIAVG